MSAYEALVEDAVRGELVLGIGYRDTLDELTRRVLDAIPNGWAKDDGRWVTVESLYKDAGRLIGEVLRGSAPSPNKSDKKLGGA